MLSHCETALSEIFSEIITFKGILCGVRFLHWYDCRCVLQDGMFGGNHFLFLKGTFPAWILILEKSSSLTPQLLTSLQPENHVCSAMLAPHGDQLADVLQHHVSVQLPLGCVQQGPLLLGEVHSDIFKHH